MSLDQKLLKKAIKKFDRVGADKLLSGFTVYLNSIRERSTLTDNDREILTFFVETDNSKLKQAIVFNEVLYYPVTTKQKTFKIRRNIYRKRQPV